MPRRLPLPTLALFALVAVSCAPEVVPDPDVKLPFDILITHARVVDGAGNPWYRADIGITADRIAAIGDLEGFNAQRVIDAADRVVAPGFVDMMGQSSLVLITDPPSAESKLRQGITTYLSGEGSSPAPQRADSTRRPTVIGTDTLQWETLDEYFQIMERYGIPLNVIHNVGATQVRQVVLGDTDAQPTPEQLEEMRELVRRTMEDGAVGLSSSLIYPPAVYASTQELIALAEAAGEHGGVYLTHIRNESGGLLDAIREALTIGAQADVPVHIYHLKAAGQENWPLMERALALIDSARAAGQDVTADIYPYLRNGLGLSALIHPGRFTQGSRALRESLSDPTVRRELRREIEATSDWENWYRHAGRNWDNVLIVSASDSTDKRVVGESVAGAARLLGTDAWTAFFDLVQAGGVSVNPLTMNEEQKWAAFRRDWVMVDTDASPSNPATTESAHPRAYGAFPRVIAKYVREDKVMTLEDAVRRMTSLAAHRLGLFDRGIIAPGMVADLLVFDPDSIQDRATYENPLQYATGVDWVLVNGEPVIAEGELQPAKPGRLLRR
ncbi:MAG TPA: D-aminoacylase [Longimicrobiales bacterium]|nr:D-aminoacylase [Longimicrobiales bacterium]